MDVIDRAEQEPEPILIARCRDLLGDDADTLGERIHAQEHRLLVEAIRLYGEGRLEMAGRAVNVTDQASRSQSG